MSDEGPVTMPERLRAVSDLAAGLVVALVIGAVIVAVGGTPDVEGSFWVVAGLGIVFVLAFSFAFPRLRSRRQREHMPGFRSR